MSFSWFTWWFSHTYGAAPPSHVFFIPLAEIGALHKSSQNEQWLFGQLDVLGGGGQNLGSPVFSTSNVAQFVRVQVHVGQVEHHL